MAWRDSQKRAISPRLAWPCHCSRGKRAISTRKSSGQPLRRASASVSVSACWAFRWSWRPLHNCRQPVYQWAGQVWPSHVKCCAWTRPPLSPASPATSRPPAGSPAISAKCFERRRHRLRRLRGRRRPVAGGDPFPRAARTKRALRALVAIAAGDAAAAALSIEQVAPADWVKESLGRSAAGARRPLHRAWRARPRARQAQ